jgi:hypothetical protein
MYHKQSSNIPLFGVSVASILSTNWREGDTVIIWTPERMVAAAAAPAGEERARQRCEQG